LVSIACLTILSGGLGALVQNNIQKVFSFLIICHIGFMIAGLSMHSSVALTGAIFYMIHDIVVKGNLFMVGGLIYKIKGSNSMKDLGGFYGSYPKLSLLMLIPLFSLIGIPPLSGFWPKLSLLKGGFEGQHYILIGFILLGSFLTLFVIAKMWTMVFWKASTGIPRRPNFRYFGDLKFKDKLNMVIPIAILAVVSLYIGFFAEHIQLLSERISFELMHPEGYIEAVLGKAVAKDN
jgi:multicomponent Na+:H+ antiporter subunit D